MRRIGMLTLALVLVVAACGRGDDDAATTTSVGDASAPTSLLVDPAGDDSAAAESDEAETTAGSAETTTSTTQVVSGTPTYEVAERIEGDDGDDLIVVVEPGTYSEVELQNLVFDIVERFEPVSAVVVDDPAAVPLLGAEELTEAEAEFLADHTFLSITDGVEVTFAGPYSEIADLTIGS